MRDRLGQGEDRQRLLDELSALIPEARLADQEAGIDPQDDGPVEEALGWIGDRIAGWCTPDLRL